MADSWTTCEVCDVDLPYPEGFTVTLEDSRHTELVKRFCTWEHLSQWVERGEPEFDRLQYQETLGDRAFKLGCLLAGLLLLTFMLVGAVEVLRMLL